jgi:pilus assembly protein FimV
MYMHTRWNTLLSVVLLWAGFSVPAWAAGMGPITVRSLLGQPFVADVELVLRDRKELDGLTARIASAEAHRTANVPYNAFALGLKASIQQNKDGRAWIRVQSDKPVTEPALQLLIELASSDASTRKEYYALLEPPEVQRK